MSRGIRKTGIFIAVMLMVVVLTGCQIAKKDESGQAKEELYGAYAVVGDRIPDGKIAGVKDKKGFVHFKKIKGYFLYKYMPEKDTVSMDGDPQLTHFNFVSNVDGQMDDKNNITSKEKEQKVKATMYVQETKGIVTTSLGMICKRSDGTVYLKNTDGFKGCASVQDFGKGQSMTLNFSSDVGDKKISYEVEFKADRAVKKIQIIEMNKDDVKIKKTAYISPKIKQYQMQKDTAYVIINEQLIGMKGQTINRQKIHSAKKNFTYKWKQLGDDGVLTPTDLKFKK